MPNTVMLDYAERLFFSQFANGVKRTLWYELLDENATPNDYWHQAGLLTASYAPKPAYTGLQNISALLRDQTPYTPRTMLNVSFGGQIQSEDIGQLLLQKNNGSFWLAVWSNASEWTPAANGVPGSYVSPAPALVPNSMNFLGTYVASITEYDEDNNGVMTSTSVPVSAGSTAQVSIGPRPKIFEIVPGVAPTPSPAPVIPNPTAHWALDEGSGSVASDSVNAAGNMTFTLGTQAAWIAGEYNSALSFSGTEASTTGVFLDATLSYSATAWVQMNNLSGYQAAVAVNGVNQSAFAIDFTPQSNLSFSVYTADSASTSLARIGSTFVPAIGKWYPVAVTYNGTTRLMSLYINGTLQSTETATGVFKAAGGTELGSMLQEGGLGHWQFWNGGVDEVNLYQYELTPAQVQTMAGQ